MDDGCRDGDMVEERGGWIITRRDGYCEREKESRGDKLQNDLKRSWWSRWVR